MHGTGFVAGDNRVEDSDFDLSPNQQVTSGGAFRLKDRMRNLLKAVWLGSRKGLSLPDPRPGQNIDMITVTKTLPAFKFPFIKDNAGLPQEVTLKGTAYGGEDPYMYALPRWGTLPGKKTPEWRRLLSDAKDHPRDPD